MEFAVQINVIRHLSKEQYQTLRELCQLSNNLYNVALYNIRQYFFNQKLFLNYENNYHECKNNENYVMLQAGVAQQTLKVADRSFKSFFNLLKKCKTGDYRYHDVKIPHYRKKGGYFNLILSTNAISVKDGYFKLPISREYRKAHPNMEDILIPYPDRLNGAELKEVHICPYDNGRYFKIQYVYHWHKKVANVNSNNIMAIDLGVENLATCTSNVETPFIMDGRKLKSINQYWNKEKARLQSVAMKQGQRTTHQINKITAKRNNQVKDIIKKSARYIVNNCIEHQIGTLVVGYNKDFKRSVNIGKVNNQNFVQIPLGDLRKQLEFLCWTYGIEYIEQEESYTSKSSFIDNDILPEYKAEQPYLGKFSGKRIHRGLYQSKDGTVINADVNGSANIGRKCKQNFNIEELSSGLLASPKRIRVA
ncbi:MAG: RNA-guided endonuclease InsQ/TnpB family protein [Lachnospiraceae bacterium]